MIGIIAVLIFIYGLIVFLSHMRSEDNAVRNSLFQYRIKKTTIDGSDYFSVYRKLPWSIIWSEVGPSYSRRKTSNLESAKDYMEKLKELDKPEKNKSEWV